MTTEERIKMKSKIERSAIEMLVKHQWSGADKVGRGVCPECGAWSWILYDGKTKHRKDCALDGLIKGEER